MKKRQEDSYLDVASGKRESAVGYLLEAILKSRAECQMPSNEKVFDEDVNIYLAHLLFAVGTNAYQRVAHRYISPYDSEVRDLMNAADDTHVKYFILKVNADHLLVHLSIFQDLVPMHGGESQPFRQGEHHFMGNAKNYYEEAANYNRKVYRKQTAVGEVLVKLAQHLQQYVYILRCARRGYFHFLNQFQSGEFAQFVSEVHDYERQMTLQAKQEQFLDLYATWLKTNDQALIEPINTLVRAIRELDPTFHFRLTA